MKVIQKDKPSRGLTCKTIPIPEPGEHEVLLRVTASGICGTDVHIYDWDDWSRKRIHPPVVIGHELAGYVVKLGKSVRHLDIGQRVSVEGHIACGHCEFCRTGQAHICRDVEIIGIDRNGCFAEYICIDAGNVWPVPDAIPDHIAALFDPVGNAMHTVMAEPVTGKSVLITGAGAVGLFATAIAQSCGASPIIVIEPNDYKRVCAIEAGVDCAIAPDDENLEDIILSHTGGLGPQIFLEMSGQPEAVSTGLHLLRNGGCACVLGIPSKPLTINWADDIVFKGITIKAINGRRMYDTWFQTQNFMLKNQDSINRLITHRLPFDQYESGFDLLHNGNAVKIVLEMN